MPTPEKISQNDRVNAVIGLVRLMGGLDGYMRSTTEPKLAELLDPDTHTDALEGLVSIGRQGGRIESNPFHDDPINPDEPPVDPFSTRAWLLASGRAIQLPSGEIVLTDEAKDHLSLAALHIASGNKPMILSEAYRAITDNLMPWSAGTTADLAKNILEVGQEAGNT